MSADMDQDTRRVIEMAAETSCDSGNGEQCRHHDCLHCAAAKLLPPLRCACGVYSLDRSEPSVWDGILVHRPDKCAARERATHCPACAQRLPVGQ